MTTVALTPAPARREPAVPNALVAVVIVVFTEAMLFAGLVSAYVVLRSQFNPWPPLGQPRLPVEITAVATLLLLGSGYTVSRLRTATRRALGATLALGLAFLAIQGSEWVALVNEGLTTTSSVYGGLFYTIVGAHALHALAGVAVLGIAWLRVARLRDEGLRALRLYWLFVVLLWPILYIAVYLW